MRVRKHRCVEETGTFHSEKPLIFPEKLLQRIKRLRSLNVQRLLANPGRVLDELCPRSVLELVRVRETDNRRCCGGYNVQ